MAKTILITGIGGNLGQAVARKFLDEGYHVVGTLLPDEKFSDDIRGDIRTQVINLLDERATADFVSGLGAIDVAVLTAGGFAMGGILNTDGLTMAKMIGINFNTAYFTVRPVFKLMQGQSQGGRIFLIGAKSALMHSSGNGALAYNISKSMIFKLAELLNAEGGSKDVVTHVVVPSIIDTPQNRKSMPDSDFGKWVKPAGIAEAIAFAASDRGHALREMVIKVYGGS